MRLSLWRSRCFLVPAVLVAGAALLAGCTPPQAVAVGADATPAPAPALVSVEAAPAPEWAHFAPVTVAPGKEILGAQFMARDFSRKITSAPPGRTVGLLVGTRGYQEGDEVRLTLAVRQGRDAKAGQKEIHLIGRVEADGFVRIVFDVPGQSARIDPGAPTTRAPALPAGPPKAKGWGAAPHFRSTPAPGDPSGTGHVDP